MNEKPIAHGKSSFNIIDSKTLFVELYLKDDTVFLDVACGIGLYSLAAADYISDKGRIYAVDLWDDGINSLKNEVSELKLNYVHASVSDVSKKIPVDKNEIDVCLMATVFHDLIEDKTDVGTLNEITRVLKTNGILAIVEFKKIEGPPGPPLKIRISPVEVETRLTAFGFQLINSIEIGQYHYLSTYTKT